MSGLPEWVTINKHLQSIGTATCDVSNLILQADDCKDPRVKFILMSAARDLLDARQIARVAVARAMGRRQKPKRQMAFTLARALQFQKRIPHDRA